MTTIVERRAHDPDAVIFVCDFSPPRGPDPELLEPARRLDADYISVAYNPGKSIRVNSALAAHWITQNTGKDVLFTLASRDMNKVAAQSLLLGAALLGLRNLVIVKGDEFSERELSVVKAVDDFKPTEFVDSVRSMNEGLDFKGAKLRSPTDFCVGATIDLGRGIDSQLKLTRRKVEAGAQFFLLQSLFDTQPLADFLDRYASSYGEALTAPVFCGIQVMAPEGIVFGDTPKWVTDDMAKGRTGEEIALQVLHQFVDTGFRSIYLVSPILRGGRREYSATQRVMESFRA